MNNFTNILMALTKRDSPLLWRGVRGEAKSVNIFRVNIPNDNTKNINTLTIEIVGFDVTRVHPFAKKIDLIQLSPPSTHLLFVTSHSSLVTSHLSLVISHSPLNYLIVFQYAFTTIFGALTAATKLNPGNRKETLRAITLM